MGSLMALPALDLKTPQQPDILQKFGQLAALRNAQQEYQQRAAMAPLQQQQAQQSIQSGQLGIQQQQQALKDQQAMTAAMHDWDGKDVNSLIPLVIKNGASAQAVMGLKSKVLEQQQTYSKIAADDATTGAKNLETMKGKNDMIAGALGNVSNMPDDQLAQGLVQTAQDLAQKGLLDPPHVQMAQQIAQSGDPAAIRQKLSLMQKGLMSESQQMDAAQKQAQTASETATAAEKNMNVARGGSTDVDKFESDYLKANGLPDTAQNRLAAFKEYTKETKIQPAEVRASTYLQMPQAVADPNNPGNTVFVTRKDAIGKEAPNSGDVKTVQANEKYFTSGKGGQQLTAFNTATQHLNLLDKLATDLNNSNIQVFNKAAQAWAQQTGNPAPTNFEAAKNAMAGEVAATLKASGATDPEIAKVDSTFSRVQSPIQLKGAIATYRLLLNSKAANLKAQYNQGQQGKPNFGDQNGGNTADPFAQFGGKAH